MENAEILFEEILKNNPDAKKPNLEKWANEFRLIRGHKPIKLFSKA